MKNKYFGFTLSETLITLGIIGVVAAITLPTIINKINDMHYNSLRKKALSTIEQAYWQIYEEQGAFPESLCTNNNSKCFGELFKQKLKTNLETVWIPNSNELPGCWSNKNLANPGEQHYCFSTVNNIFYDFDMEVINGVPFINIDVNGKNRPNTWGKDIYTIRIVNRKFQVYNYPMAFLHNNPNVFE